MLNDGAPVSQKGIKATITADLNTFRDFNVSSSSFTDNTTGSISTDFLAGSDSIWGTNNVTSGAYYWNCNGMIAFIEPGDSKIKMGIHHRKYYSSNGDYWFPFSETDLTNKTYGLNSESYWTYVTDGGGSGSSNYANWRNAVQWREAVLAPDGTTPFVYGSGYRNECYQYGGTYRPGQFGTFGTSQSYYTQLVIDKNHRAWMRSSYYDRNNVTPSYYSHFVCGNVGPWTVGYPDRTSSYRNSNYGCIAIDASGQYVCDIQGSSTNICQGA